MLFHYDSKDTWSLFIHLFIMAFFSLWPGEDTLILHENLFIVIKFQKMKLQSQRF